MWTHHYLVVSVHICHLILVCIYLTFLLTADLTGTRPDRERSFPNLLLQRPLLEIKSSPTTPREIHPRTRASLAPLQHLGGCGSGWEQKDEQRPGADLDLHNLFWTACSTQWSARSWRKVRSLEMRYPGESQPPWSSCSRWRLASVEACIRRVRSVLRVNTSALLAGVRRCTAACFCSST